jgi:hypothetical protein
MRQPQIHIPLKQIEDFCRRWKIKEFALFGSVLRGITFDNRVEMLDELAKIFDREVDLVEKDAIRNPFRRHDILTTKEVVYAA